MNESAILSEIRDILLKTLETNDYISSADIGRMLKIPIGNSRIKPRTLIKKAIKIYKLPVYGWGKGYKMIKSLDELNKALRGLEGRINKIKDRKDMINDNFKSFYEDSDDEDQEDDDSLLDW